MAIAAARGETRILLRKVSWATYEALVAESNQAGTRLTYARGDLEIMSPSREHERFKRLIGRMIEAMTEELAIPVSSGGSTTLKSQLRERGVEPDECYYIANEPQVRGRDDLDLEHDPPPDLAIEVDITESSIDQLGVYAALGVPELWVCDGEAIRVYRLQADGSYVEQSQSATFPFLPLDELQRFLDRRNATDETTWIRSFRDWVRRWKR